ncbi:hypothetical protein LR48_Vigan10g209400 [Vigna angularis]|uniref:Uncharacterized protein n=1 Tax=Phaseolus angularis TaxID=3914 RepID=A0A0L9VMS6_PHAAN|nr:hypothetical protein LR48_Vigan10g209400 [Vigna angularis]
MGSGVRSAMQFVCYSENATLQQRTPGVMPRGVRNQLVENRKLPPSLYCYSPISSPFNIQNHRNVPCVVSFILDRTAPDSETGKSLDLDARFWMTCETKIQLHKAIVGRVKNHTLRTFTIDPAGERDTSTTYVATVERDTSPTDARKLPPSLYCYSPISSPFNIQNHRNVPCVVSFILDRTAPDSETGKSLDLDARFWMTCETKIQLHKAIVGRVKNHTLRTFTIDPATGPSDKLANLDIPRTEPQVIHLCRPTMSSTLVNTGRPSVSTDHVDHP